MIDMIKLIHINKYYNKGKTNEIHVINDTSLEFPEKGLVAITGPSGCGKTTILNIIGGMDKFDSGEIVFNETHITKYKANEVDILRNKNIGYIFQNYNLIEDKTVYENIEVSLQMAGLNDTKKIEERINYVLTAVGMYNYRRRNVKALSGGQQQRVAIARAISKNPKVILADEPTGNLDANNTFEIMTIIKKISQTCLVILVSHEKNLVKFYADKIIEISDGSVVKVYDNFGVDSFKHVDERNIYLKDLNHDNSLSEYNIDRYFDNIKDQDLFLQIIEVKDSIYIKASSNKKIKYLTDDTEVRLINEHYKEKQTSDALDYNFNMEQYGEIAVSDNKKSFINFKETLKSGFIKATKRRKLFGWMLLLAYFIISALIVYQIATFGNLMNINEKENIWISKDMINVNADEPVAYQDIVDILDNVDGLEWSPYQGNTYGRFYYYDFYQGSATINIHMFPMKESWVDENDLQYGSMPSDTTEIVIDEWVADKLIANKQLKDLGVNSYEGILGQKIYSNNQENLDFTVVGIIKTESPIVVVKDDAYLSFVNESPFYSYGSMKDRITIVDGRDLQANDEILVLKDSSEYEIGDVVPLFNGVNYTVVGTYILNDSDVEDRFYMNLIGTNEAVEYISMLMFQSEFSYYYYEGDVSGIYFYSENIEQSSQEIINYNNKYIVSNAYDAQIASLTQAKLQKVQARITSVLVIIVGIIVYIYFIMRSSMLSRIKEIGIYRSIGATKRDIYKIFLGEIIALTTIGSLTGYLAMSAIINRVQHALGDMLDVFYLPIHYFLAGILFIYVINILFGMLPIMNLLRKTPSEINAKYDI